VLGHRENEDLPSADGLVDNQDLEAFVLGEALNGLGKLRLLESSERNALRSQQFLQRLGGTGKRQPMRQDDTQAGANVLQQAIRLLARIALIMYQIVLEQCDWSKLVDFAAANFL
jgi:hypothetical protein